jgi:hypothetical protein
MGGDEDRLERELRERGAQAQAEIRGAQKTTNVLMESGNTWFVWKLKLRVRPTGEPSFDADVRHRYAAGEDPTIGSKLTVLYDPADHSALCVDGTPPRSAGPPAQLVQRLAADLGAIETDRLSAERVEHLTRAADLHEQGVLTDAEFEQLKQKILAS